jgi:hypothetical protein
MPFVHRREDRVLRQTGCWLCKNAVCACKIPSVQTGASRLCLTQTGASRLCLTGGIRQAVFFLKKCRLSGLTGRRHPVCRDAEAVYFCIPHPVCREHPVCRAIHIFLISFATSSSNKSKIMSWVILFELDIHD